MLMHAPALHQLTCSRLAELSTCHSSNWCDSSDYGAPRLPRQLHVILHRPIAHDVLLLQAIVTLSPALTAPHRQKSVTRFSVHCSSASQHGRASPPVKRHVPAGHEGRGSDRGWLLWCLLLLLLLQLPLLSALLTLPPLLTEPGFHCRKQLAVLQLGYVLASAA